MNVNSVINGYITIEEKKSEITIYYHGTSSKNIDSILKYGLDKYARYTKKNKGWGAGKNDKTYTYTDTGELDDVDIISNQGDRLPFENYPGVYLTDNLEAALSAAEDVSSYTGGYPTLIAVRVDPRSLVADEDDVLEYLFNDYGPYGELKEKAIDLWNGNADPEKFFEYYVEFFIKKMKRVSRSLGGVYNNKINIPIYVKRFKEVFYDMWYLLIDREAYYTADKRSPIKDSIDIKMTERLLRKKFERLTVHFKDLARKGYGLYVCSDASLNLCSLTDLRGTSSGRYRGSIKFEGSTPKILAIVSLKDGIPEVLYGSIPVQELKRIGNISETLSSY